MNNTIPQFDLFCPELSEEQHKHFYTYLEHFCPKGDASFYKNYLYRLYWLASRSKSKKMIELGARPGGSCMALLFAAELNDGHVWSIDIQGIPDTQMKDFGIDDSRRTTISGVRAADAGRTWSGGKVDLIYLDTSHEYKDTCEEIEAWMPHLQEGGLFVFHDTEVYKASVLLPICNAIIKSPELFELHHFPDCHGHAVLQWFSGAQTSGGCARPEQKDNVVSLTTLLLLAKTTI